MQLPPLRTIRSLGCGVLAWVVLCLAFAPLAAAESRAAEGDPEDASGAAASESAEAEDAPEAEAAPEPEPTTEEREVPGVEVIRVRGRAGTAIETEIPSSITQFDAATIEALGAQDISDLSRVTPNVSIVQPGATQAIFFVRGIGLSDFSSNAAGAVTVFQDDVALNAPAIQTGQLFDVEGVEIVRGPQGTGPFRNASAGAIRVRARRPTGNYGAQLRSTLGRFAADGGKGAHHALIQDYEGALELPLVEDALSSRFAFRLRDAEPYKTNGCANAKPFDQRQPRVSGARVEDIDICGERGRGLFDFNDISRVPTGLPRRVGDEHNWAARGTFRFQPPGSEAEFFLNGHGSMLDQQATLGQTIGTRSWTGAGSLEPPFGGPNGQGYIEPDAEEEFERLCQRPGGPSTLCTNRGAATEISRQLRYARPLDLRPYRGDYNRVGQTTRDAWGVFASGAGTLGGLELFGLVAYDQYERTNDQDIDFSPDLLFELDDDDRARQSYEELRVGGELPVEPIEWEIGGYHLQERLEFDGTTFVHSGNGFIDIDRIYSQSIQSFGVWGKFGWDFTEELTLEGGVRYNWEQKEFDFQRVQTGRPPPTGFRQATGAEQDETWQTPTGEIVLTYHIDDNKSAYARYTRGFKAGHFNALASEDLGTPPAEPEFNDAWEAGLSGSWLDRRLSLSASYFYYRYTGYQVFLFTDAAQFSAPPVLEILNAKLAENYGIELEGRLEPLRGWVPRLFEGLRLSGNFSWLHGEYLDFSQTRNLRATTGGFPTRFSITVDYAGNQFQNSPAYKASGTAEWTFDFGRWGSLIPRYDVNWTHDSFFDPNGGRGSATIFTVPALREYSIGQRAFYLHNVRLAYRTPAGNIEVAGWMRNATDEVYKNFAFDVSAFVGSTIQFPGEPRTIGFDVSILFF